MPSAKASLKYGKRDRRNIFIKRRFILEIKRLSLIRSSKLEEERGDEMSVEEIG